MKKVLTFIYKVVVVIYYLIGFAISGLIFKYLRIETPMVRRKWKYEGKLIQRELNAQHK